MTELVRFDVGDGATVVVELKDDEPGIERASRDGDRVLRAAVNLDGALEQVRTLANAALEKLRGLAERPAEIEVEFGLRLNAETGVVIARTQAEGHVQVRLTWHKPTNP